MGKVHAVIVMVNAMRTKTYLQAEPDLGLDIDLTCAMISGVASFAHEAVRAPLQAILIPPRKIIVAHVMETPQFIVWALMDMGVDTDAAYKILMDYAYKYLDKYIQCTEKEL